MISHVLSNDVLLQLSNVVASRLGLNFPAERFRDLENGIDQAVGNFGLLSKENTVQTLLSSNISRKQLEILASSLTVGETYFFRDSALFELLEHKILPELIDLKRQKEKSIRIWSAGCCTGEEPYSVAMLLRDLMPDLDEWNITILASDINPNFLEKMKTGKYSKWSFRSTKEELIRKHFTARADNQFEIDEAIRKMVIPSYLNLAEDVFPSLLNNTNAMDIIICRNVLMYFTPSAAERVVKQFNRALVDDGLLIIGPAEVSHSLFTMFSTVNFPGVILYKKDDEHAQNVNAAKVQPVDTSEKVKPAAELFLHDEMEIEKYHMLPETVSPILARDERETKPAAYLKAKEFYEQGQYSEALSEVQKYISNNEEDANAYALMSRVLANQGKLREAFAWCEKAIQLDKLNPTHQYLLATILQEQKRLHEALTALKRAIYLDRKFVLAHVVAGNVSARLGYKDESKKNFRNAIELIRQYKPEALMPESGGMTAQRLIEIIQSVTV